jgi:hypothetical protein
MDHPRLRGVADRDARITPIAAEGVVQGCDLLGLLLGVRCDDRELADCPQTCSVGDVYRASDEFKRLSEGTQSNYEVTMRRFEHPETWGLVAVRDLMPLAVQTARDSMKDTPVMANQMLSVSRTIWDWAIPLGLAQANPFDKLRDFDIPDRGHVPWPAWVVDYVRQHAWPDLVRMERLGIWVS